MPRGDSPAQVRAGSAASRVNYSPAFLFRGVAGKMDCLGHARGPFRTLYDLTFLLSTGDAVFCIRQQKLPVRDLEFLHFGPAPLCLSAALSTPDLTIPTYFAYLQEVAAYLPFKALPQ